MLIRFACASVVALLLAGCGTAVAPPGPAGPPGPPGQRGAQFAKPLFADADLTVDADIDVVVARSPLSVTLPAAQNAGRLITVRAAGGAVIVRAGGGELVEQAETIALDDGEMATFMAGGPAGWYVISSSDL